MSTKDNRVIFRPIYAKLSNESCSFDTVDGVKQCSMCVDKAVKEKLEEFDHEVSKPSPIHRPWEQSEESLFHHPLPLSQHNRYAWEGNEVGGRGLGGVCGHIQGHQRYLQCAI